MLVVAPYFKVDLGIVANCDGPDTLQSGFVTVALGLRRSAATPCRATEIYCYRVYELMTWRYFNV
jgi:hypothetical protein